MKQGLSHSLDFAAIVENAYERLAIMELECRLPQREIERMVREMYELPDDFKFRRPKPPEAGG